MKKIYVIVLMVGICTISIAQQQAMFSQYMFNPFAINPAYAGTRESFSGTLLSRSQWVGMDGAPNTQSLSMHTPFKKYNMAAGMNLIHETIGPNRNIAISGTYAYHFKLGAGKLSLAARGGVFQTTLDKNKLVYLNQQDALNSGGGSTGLMPSFDFGAYYFTNNLFVGAAVNHINEGRGTFTNDQLLTFYINRHYMTYAGFAHELNEKLVLKPSLMARYVENAPVSLDINFSMLYNKFIWFGASYRMNNAVVLLTEINITDFVRIGYSYDIILNPLRNYNNGTHEIFLGWDLAIGKQKSINPRYL
jgi:type IX secretion system PorP/SprF family membrane protein